MVSAYRHGLLATAMTFAKAMDMAIALATAMVMGMATAMAMAVATARSMTMGLGGYGHASPHLPSPALSVAGILVKPQGHPNTAHAIIAKSKENRSDEYSTPCPVTADSR